MVLKKKKKPKFNVLNAGFMPSVKSRWRRPRGVDNKKRIRKKFAGASPRVGYGTPESLKHLHPTGLKELMVHNLNELAAATKKHIVRIAGGVGQKKKKEIVAKAKTLGVEVINKGV